MPRHTHPTPTCIPERRDELTHYVQSTYDAASQHTAADLSRALAYVDRHKRRFADFFNTYDLLLTPAMAVTAFPIGQHPTTIAGRSVEPWWGYLPFTFPINMSGQTASSVPCGFSAAGLPVGLHIVGPAGRRSTRAARHGGIRRGAAVGASPPGGLLTRIHRPLRVAVAMGC